jgi:hypothetical protein
MSRIHIDHDKDTNPESPLFWHGIHKATRRYVESGDTKVSTMTHEMEMWETEAGFFISIKRGNK